MTDTNDDLDLQNLWQDSPPVDVDELMRSVNRAHKGMRRFVYFEIVTTVIGIGFLTWAYLADVFGSHWWIAPVVGVITMGSQLWMWSWRRGLWGAFAESPDELFELKRKHLLLDIKLARSFYWGGGFVLLTIGAVIVFPLGIESTLNVTETRRTLVRITAAIFSLWMIVWGVRKENRSRKQLEKLENQLKEFREQK